MAVSKRKAVTDSGLPSLNEARAERRRAIALGRVRMASIPPQFWLWTAVALGVFTVVYWRISQGQIETRRSQVMAKQRAIAVGLGPKIIPFRDQVEGWVRELAAGWPGDFVDPSASLDKISTSPGVYFRLRMANTSSVKAIRAAARASLHDGFTSCLFVRLGAPDPTKGPACRVTADCSPGQLCNEWNVCSEPPRPYNMRLAYRALRVLSNDWTDEVHEADTELGLNAYDRDLDSVSKRDVPVAIELLSRSRYFTLVLDEDPDGGLPPEAPDAGETSDERVQREPHGARIGIWDLKTRSPLLRLKADARGEFVPVGDRVVRNPATLAAEQRQTNSCALALAVREALAKNSAAADAK
ncbi:MAG TPA: hypothetical protein VHV51_14415 [Polyangiaceae bacterium]|nr:hypothetical protein [Polyangiaceae bacterium]